MTWVLGAIVVDPGELVAVISIPTVTEASWDDFVVAMIALDETKVLVEVMAVSLDEVLVEFAVSLPEAPAAKGIPW